MRRAQGRGDARGRLDGVAAEERPGERAGPGVEELDDLRPGVDLGEEVAGGRLGDPRDQRVEGRRVAVDQRPRRRLVGGAAAGDHVGRHRPGRAGEADERHVRRQRRAHDAARSRRPAPGCRGPPRRGAGGRGPPGVVTVDSRGPSPSTKARSAPRACGTRRMSAKRIAASKPKRRIGWSVTSVASSGRVAELEEAAGAGADGAVLGQVATGLAHQPDRRHREGLAAEGAHHRPVVHAPPRLAARRARA